MKKSRPVVAVCHPRLLVGGGSEAAAVWICSALKDDYSVVLISMGPVDLDALNLSYGAGLTDLDIRIIELPIPRIMNRMFDALRLYGIIRYVRKNLSTFDVLISSYNPMDFGKPGIQFIGDLTFDDFLRQKLDTRVGKRMRFYHKPSLFRKLYHLFGRWLTGQQKWGWKNNLTVANSNWTQRILKETFGVDSVTIYPSIIADFPDVPFDRREDGFIFIGRLVPEKRIPFVIEIIKEIRRRGWPLHLHLVGRAEDKTYADGIKKLCSENQEWLFYEGEIYGQEKNELISMHKYGISGRENEPFGITVAEYTKAGCLVWVPCGGGQVEIVDHPSLIYKDFSDAVTKIERVLQEQNLQKELLDHLKNQAELFTTQNFVEKTKDIVDRFFRKNHNS